MRRQHKVYPLNQKVQISDGLAWAKGQTGVISHAPPEVLQIAEGWINEYCRRIQTPKGEKLFYWVVFDSPQFDDAGDGPFSGVEIAGQYLEIREPKEESCHL